MHTMSSSSPFNSQILSNLSSPPPPSALSRYESEEFGQFSFGDFDDEGKTTSRSLSLDKTKQHFDWGKAKIVRMMSEATISTGDTEPTAEEESFDLTIICNATAGSCQSSSTSENKKSKKKKKTSNSHSKNHEEKTSKSNKTSSGSRKSSSSSPHRRQKNSLGKITELEEIQETRATRRSSATTDTDDSCDDLDYDDFPPPLLKLKSQESQEFDKLVMSRRSSAPPILFKHQVSKTARRSSKSTSPKRRPQKKLGEIPEREEVHECRTSRRSSNKSESNDSCEELDGDDVPPPPLKLKSQESQDFDNLVISRRSSAPPILFQPQASKTVSCSSKSTSPKRRPQKKLGGIPEREEIHECKMSPRSSIKSEINDSCKELDGDDVAPPPLKLKSQESQDFDNLVRSRRASAPPIFLRETMVPFGGYKSPQFEQQKITANHALRFPEEDDRIYNPRGVSRDAFPPLNVQQVSGALRSKRQSLTDPPEQGQDIVFVPRFDDFSKEPDHDSDQAAVPSFLSLAPKKAWEVTTTKDVASHIDRMLQGK